jgi:hypothetical protein
MSLSISTGRNVASVRVLDACGAVLSGLCAVHCALMPLLITALPALASHGVETSLRRCLVLVGILGVGLGAWVHRSRGALWPLGGAIVLATLLELHVIGMAWEVFPSLALSALLITAHAKNSRACHEELECCPNEHGAAPYWGDFIAQAPRGSKNANTAIVAFSAAVLVHAVVIAIAVHFGVTQRPLAMAVRTTEVELDVAPTLVAEPATAPRSEPKATTLPASEVAPPPVMAAVRTSAAAPAVPAAPPVAFDRALGVPSADAAPVAFGEALGAPRASHSGALAPSGSGVHAGNSVGRAQGTSPPDAKGPVEAALLSRRPVQPPGLGARIESHYPAEARLQQLTGRGSARALVSPEGVVVAATPAAETPARTGFAAACANALRGSTGWGTALDGQGHAVSTWIRFSCEFGIRY